MSQVISKDGTAIDYTRAGSGPAVILVDGAFCSREFGPSPKIVPLLSPHFTIYSYDRRGRGASGDTAPYAVAREVEDLAALVQAAGGSASLVGLSSGAGLALEAAASGLPVNKVVAYEPPYIDDEGTRGGATHEVRLKALLAQGDRAAAAKYFMKDMVGAPAFVVAIMPLMPWIWRKLVAAAHTLPYDAAIMTQYKIPRARLGTVRTPTLVMNGTKTDARLSDAARKVSQVVPGAAYRELAGQTHNVSAKALVPAVVEFLRS